VTRVLIADDDDLMRAGLVELLTADPEIEIIGQASTGREAVERARRLAPDVVLMDVRMPDLDGIGATRELARVAPAARVLIVTTFEQDDYVFGALRAGASGFLLKDVEPADLVTAVRVVAGGEALLAPRLTRRLIEEFVARETPTPALDPGRLEELTAREREVLELVGRGLSNAELAARLFISPLTAKTHVARLFAKTGARDRAQLVVCAYESGLVVPGAG
jgi:DNA-binding NarL/FixJ family response regulator